MTNSKSWLKDITILVILLGVFFFSFLGMRPLAVPDEGRYAEIPREMLATHDLVTPHINYIKYFEKPVLFYWMQAAALKVFGINEWGARFMTALMGLFGCLMTYVAGRILYDRRTGWLASLILATATLYYVMARFVTIDMTFSVLLTGCLFSFILAHKALDSRLRGNDAKSATIFILLMFIFSALATLAKGLIGFVFPGMIIFAWLLLFNDWRNLKYYLAPLGILLWFGLVLPWHILVQLRNPEFFHFYIIEQHFSRYLTNYAHREQPIWFMTVFVFAGFLPWTVFLFQALKARWPKTWVARFSEKTALYLMLWPALIFLFYQFSHSLLPPYVLPIFPPLAILVGSYLALKWEQTHWRKAITTVFIVTVLILTSVNFTWPLWQTKSTKPLAQLLLPKLTPNDQVVIYHAYFHDLPFYLQQRVVIVGWGVQELEFGMAHQNMQDWLWDDPTFWKKWSGTQHLFMFLSQKDYNTLLKDPSKRLCLLGQTQDMVLVSNHCN